MPSPSVSKAVTSKAKATKPRPSAPASQRRPAQSKNVSPPKSGGSVDRTIKAGGASAAGKADTKTSRVSNIENGLKDMGGSIGDSLGEHNDILNKRLREAKTPEEKSELTKRVDDARLNRKEEDAPSANLNDSLNRYNDQINKAIREAGTDQEKAAIRAEIDSLKESFMNGGEKTDAEMDKAIQKLESSPKKPMNQIPAGSVDNLRPERAISR